MSLTGIFAPAMFASIFAAAIALPSGAGWPGAAFLLASVLLGLGLALAFWVTRGSARQTQFQAAG